MNIQAHGGNIWRLSRELNCRPESILDFSASMNPFGPPEWLSALIRDNMASLTHYPDPDCHDLLQAASRRHTIPVEELIADNGTAEILFRLPPLLGLNRAVVPGPAYGDYHGACETHGLEIEHMPLNQDNGFNLDWEELQNRLHEPALVLLGQPNNPTGRTVCPETLRRVARAHPRSWFIVDEAFADFVPDLDRMTRDRPDNVIVLLSLTKFYSIPGLRIGLAAMNAQLVLRYMAMCPAWSVNTLAQLAGTACLADFEFQQLSRERNNAQRTELAQTLARLPDLRVYPSAANFLLCRTTHSRFNALQLAEKLLAQRITIRTCSNFSGLDERYFRVAVRLPEENQRLCDALSEIFLGNRPSRISKSPTPALMFQGTGSDAGKSLLAAALCRILRQDGFSPAPFKAQNMALNSGVTPDGGEIGRAQMLQAQACGLEADRRMNPVLLKPNSETGSQVIVLGRPQGNMSVSDYIRAKEKLRSVVHEAYDGLAAEHDVMVLEGAGSPAEINLKRHDLVNMTMARHAGAAVYLVGDIDRGGVFAALSGTMDTLEGWEREMVRGLVINKFRGQRSLLDPALEWITRRTGRPMVGVVPYLADLGLPEEDSVGFKQGRLFHSSPPRTEKRALEDAVLDVACLDLPHISNFTDLDPLAAEPSVSLRLVRTANDLGNPDLLILPGTKNVMADMAFLRERGLVAAILDLTASAPTQLIGICGGFQMLGEVIHDPHGLESSTTQSVTGLGLLSMTTSLESSKTLCRTAAVHLPSGLEVAGYEIHHGRSAVRESGHAAELVPIIRNADGQNIGYGRRDGPIWGSYLHGIFDNTSFRHWLLNNMLAVKGADPLCGVQGWDLEPALDRLADHVRQHLDIDQIYKTLRVR
ncbi:cobyric acid synthase [Desulfonatronum thiosulfatophilum]|nr:cobyric acid synthase [Desulfonatronum thiosulfatophilum]